LELRRDLLDEGVVRKAKNDKKLWNSGWVMVRMFLGLGVGVGRNCRALGRAAFLQLYLLYNGLRLVHRNRVLETVENFVRRVLQTSVRLVQLPRCLRCQLAQLIAVMHVRESSKNKI
jgi:hypothetical protein